MRIIKFYGGPLDGDEQRMGPPYSDTIETQGTKTEEKDGDRVVAVLQSMHVYAFSPGQYRYEYRGDRVDREEVKEMAFRKHGVGEVLDDNGEEISKEASQQDWTAEDEQELADEE